MRGVPLHVYYIRLGQYINPIGSDRPQWAAGELLIALSQTEITCSMKRARIFKRITVGNYRGNENDFWQVMI